MLFLDLLKNIIIYYYYWHVSIHLDLICCVLRVGFFPQRAKPFTI